MKKTILKIIVLLMFLVSGRVFGQNAQNNIRDAEFFQVCVLNYEDEYLYTLPHLGTTININLYGINQSIVCKEGNPISSLFFSNNLSYIYYSLSCIGMYSGLKLFEDFDNQNFKNIPIKTSDLFIAGCQFIEIQAIHSWARYNLGPEEIKWNILNYSF